MNETSKESWVFTFSINHKHKDEYVLIEGTYGEAREKMFELFGSKWAFQYKTEEEAGVYRFGLQQLK